MSPRKRRLIEDEDVIDFEIDEFADEFADDFEDVLFETAKAGVKEQIARAEKGLWRTAQGVDKRLDSLDNFHLSCILQMYQDKRPPFHFEGLAEKLVRPLFLEAKRRGLVPEEHVDRFSLIELD